MKQWSKAVCGSKQAGRKMEPVSIHNHNFGSEPTNLPHAKDKGSKNRDLKKRKLSRESFFKNTADQREENNYSRVQFSGAEFIIVSMA